MYQNLWPFEKHIYQNTKDFNAEREGEEGGFCWNFRISLCHSNHFDETLIVWPFDIVCVINFSQNNLIIQSVSDHNLMSEGYDVKATCEEPRVKRI